MLAGFGASTRFRHAEILGVGAHALAAIAENPVARLESFYIFADRFDFPGKLAPSTVILGFVNRNTASRTARTGTHVEFFWRDRL